MKLSKTLQIYVDHIARANRPLGFLEIVAATPGKNAFWAMKRRGLVKNVVPPYSKDEVYTGPRVAKYILTELGKLYVSHSDDPYVYSDQV